MSLYIGLMSGTSSDGIDLVCTEMQYPLQSDKHFKLHATATVEYPKELQAELFDIQDRQQVTVDELAILDVKLGELYAHIINQFLQQNNISANQIEAIGYHGTTLRHRPEIRYPFTWQLGNGFVIRQRTNIPVIHNFRQLDIANGGQGAPLTALFHHWIRQTLLPNQTTPCAFINLGGIANISLLQDPEPVLGFDIGPANTLIDLWVREKQLNTLGYDKNGELAKQGRVNQVLLKKMLQTPFFSQQPPKSTGRELFNLNWLKQFDGIFELDKIEVLTTLTELTASCCIATLTSGLNSERHWQALYLLGGGVKNAYLVQRIEKQLKKTLPKCNLHTELPIDHDFVEATAWAWLAYLYTHKIPLDTTSVTQAQSAMVLGEKIL